MRHPVEEGRHWRHSGIPSPRLLTMVLMLAVVGMLIYRARDRSVWLWLAPGEEESQEAKQAPAAAGGGGSLPGGEAKKTAAPAPKLVPTGPTDEDSEEQDFMSEARQAIDDGSLYIRTEEMVACVRILTWVQNQPLALLRQRAQKVVTYDQFLSDPEQMRFRLVQLDLLVLQIIPCDVKGPGGAHLYEVRGYSTSEGGQNLYFGIVQDLPEGLHPGLDVREEVKLIGYFFKLQGYRPDPRVEKKGARPLRAPLVLGRLVWRPSPLAISPEGTSLPPWAWAALVVGVVVVVAGGVAVMAVLSRHRPRPTPLSSTYADPEAPSVDQWLDQAQAGDLPLGNNSSGNGESTGRAFGTGPQESDQDGPPRFRGSPDNPQES